jgi:hypothetical protein
MRDEDYAIQYSTYFTFIDSQMASNRKLMTRRPNSRYCDIQHSLIESYNTTSCQPCKRLASFSESLLTNRSGLEGGLA